MATKNYGAGVRTKVSKHWLFLTAPLPGALRAFARQRHRPLMPGSASRDAGLQEVVDVQYPHGAPVLQGHEHADPH